MNGDVVSVAASESLSRHVYRLSVVGFLQPEQLIFAGLPLRTAPCSRAAWGTAHFLAMRRPTSSAYGIANCTTPCVHAHVCVVPLQRTGASVAHAVTGPEFTSRLRLKVWPRAVRAVQCHVHVLYYQAEPHHDYDHRLHL